MPAAPVCTRRGDALEVLVKVSPGAVKLPSMKWPNLPPCLAIHARASVALSGAGP